MKSERLKTKAIKTKTKCHLVRLRSVSNDRFSSKISTAFSLAEKLQRI